MFLRAFAALMNGTGAIHHVGLTAVGRIPDTPE
jgi:hypothetical protein